MRPPGYLPPPVGDVLQGAAADCNSAEATHAWFDSRVAHHNKNKDLAGNLLSLKSARSQNCYDFCYDSCYGGGLALPARIGRLSRHEDHAPEQQ